MSSTASSSGRPSTIHPFLPMSYVAEGLRRLISGGGLSQVWRACAVLIVFTGGALTLTAWSAAASRYGPWTVSTRS
jgi:putative membrane protein